MSAAARFDPGRTELRAALTALGTVLATYGAAMLVVHAADQQVDLAAPPAAARTPGRHRGGPRD